MSIAQKVVADRVNANILNLSDDSLIFVGGIPRSGTTLVQNVIDSHSKILGLPEFKNIHRIINLQRQMKDEVKKGFIDLICTEQELNSYFKSFIKSFFEPLKKKHGYEYISEKTPQNLLVFQDLIELFPKSKFVLVVRDPRAIVNSTKKVNERARKQKVQSAVGSFYEYTNKIREQYQLTNKLIKKYPDKIFFIRYEDLVNDIERITKDFCQYMSINWEPEMMKPGEQHHLNEKGMLTDYNKAYYDKKLFGRNADSSSLYKWKKELTKREKNYIYKLFKRERLEYKFGYQLEKEPMSMIDHIYSTTKNASEKMVRIYYLIQRYVRKFSRI